MSAGDAGPAGDAGQAQQGEGQGEQQAPDFSALTSQVEQQGQTTEQLRDMFQGFMQQYGQQQEAGQQEPEAEDQLPDLGFLESGDPEFDQQMAQNLQSVIREEAQKVAQQIHAPLQDRIAQAEERAEQAERERAARQLTEEFPALNEHENARRVIDATNQWVQTLGVSPEMQEALKANPEVWRAVHVMDQAYQTMAQEGTQSPAAHVEGAGGAGAGQQPQQDLGDLIVNGQGEGAPLGRRVLPF